MLNLHGGLVLLKEGYKEGTDDVRMYTDVTVYRAQPIWQPLGASKFHSLCSVINISILEGKFLRIREGMGLS